MYQIKNKIYADAGYILQCNNKFAFNFKDVDIKDVLEVKINLENMQKIDNFVIYSDNIRDYISCKEYKDWKKKWINKQFTNDDQIAIILNKDCSEEDLLLFNKMQEWREGSSLISKKIVSILENFKINTNDKQ